MNTLVLLNRWRGQTGSINSERIDVGQSWGGGGGASQQGSCTGPSEMGVLLLKTLYSRQPFNHVPEVDLLSCQENSWEGIRRWACSVRFRVVEQLTKQQNSCNKLRLSSGLYETSSSETPNLIRTNEPSLCPPWQEYKLENALKY